MAKERCENCMPSDSVFCKLRAIYVWPDLGFDLNSSKHFGFHPVFPNSVKAETEFYAGSSPDSVW